jgi:nitroreductase
MDLFDAIQGRKSIRRFKQTPVPDKDINKILDAGRLAPSANNTQPWFIVIKDRALLRKWRSCPEMVDTMILMPRARSRLSGLRRTKAPTTFFEHAPVVIAVCMEGYDAGTDQLLARMGYAPEDIRRLRPLPGLQSVSAAIEHILLAAHALGYGSCWMTGPLVAQEAFGKLLGYGKETFIAALLPVGLPDEDPPARSRKQLNEILKVVV